MADLDDYAAFVAAVDHGSLTAAARALGRSLQGISRSLALLERELGTPLILRTTRRSEVTAAGLAFYDRIKAALGQIDLARAEAEQYGEVVSGRLRIAASVLFGPVYVVPVVATFMQRWPGVEVELVLNDGFANLVADRLDLAIRIGDLPSSGLRRRGLAHLRRVLFATPGYLERHGRPTTPADLARHHCVVRTIGPEQDAWPLTIEGQIAWIRVRGTFTANDAAACNEAVAAGLGIGLAPYWQIRRLIDDGRVELVLTDFEPLPVPVSAVWLPVAQLPARTRLFIDTLAARFSAERW
ncbi:LysR substrate-binding domain-containing protein [Bradyrhizobium sp. STM 3562]|uniref:LysR family transcriptional regulator n=1 Tax=Bradyrhizobium sp. STM 3562 TaxID=578924 RepID=UPI00388FC1EA